MGNGRSPAGAGKRTVPGVPDKSLTDGVFRYPETRRRARNLTFRVDGTPVVPCKMLLSQPEAARDTPQLARAAGLTSGGPPGVRSEKQGSAACLPRLAPAIA